tara:strand:- start:3240 stop:3431 length:192 start_codon:yes stop_codon:yes gene_type:complete
VAVIPRRELLSSSWHRAMVEPVSGNRGDPVFNPYYPWGKRHRRRDFRRHADRFTDALNPRGSG